MKISYSKELEVKYDVDVFVAGGGPAGIAAAVTCARQGYSVFIAEPFPAFGGAAVTMLVPAFMPFGDSTVFLAEGIGREVYNKIAAQALPRFQKYCPVSIPVETIKIIYDDMVSQSGAKFLFHTSVIDAVTENGSIKYAVCSAKGSIFAVKARIFIDCTGDGDLSDLAGAESEYGDENGLTMAATLCGLWSGINWHGTEGGHANMHMAKAIKDGVFTNADMHLPGIWRIMEETTDENGVHLPDGVGGSNAGHVYGVDARYAESLTPAIIKGRKQILEYRRYYMEYMKGYEKAEPIYTAPYLGIRESRRIVCDYRLNVEDFQRQACFEDEIGRYNYPIDVHSSTNDTAGYNKFISAYSSLRYKPGKSYGIPYRSLAVKGLANLLTAGRCIGTDRQMQASVRVIPGCYITGQTAGMAAAVLCGNHTNNVHEIDTHELQKKLTDMGAYLPNFVK